MLFGFAMWSCSEDRDIPDLVYNKWEEDIPNPIRIQGITTLATGVSSAEIRVYFEYNLDSFELAWDAVDTIYFRITGGSPEDPNPPTKIVMTAPGYGYASPSRGYQNETYTFEHQLILENGRFTEIGLGEEFESKPN